MFPVQFLALLVSFVTLTNSLAVLSRLNVDNLLAPVNISNLTWSELFLSDKDIPQLPVVTVMPKPGGYRENTTFSCKGNPNHWALTFDDGPVP